METTNIARVKNKNLSDEVKWSIYNIVINPNEMTSGKYILYNTANGKMVTSTKNFDQIENYYKEPQKILKQHEILKEMGFLVTKNVNEFYKTRFLLQQSYQGCQELVILPTEKCNFRCVYCYEEFLKGKMSIETQQNIIDFVQKNIRKWKRLDVSWFGGEPLTAYEVIKNLSKQFIEICSKNNVLYNATMTTNGYLLSIARAKELKNLGVNAYQITIDGIEEHHNSNRPLAGGGQTYKKIINNLLDIKNSDLDINITLRTNFLEENVKELDNHIDVLANYFANDKRFSFRLFPVGKWGGPNDDNLPICTSKQAHEILTKKTNYSIKKGLRSLIQTDLGVNNVCYASKPNSLVIGSDGMLYKCTVAFDNPINQVGKLEPGGKLNIDYDKFSQWISADGVSDTGCQSCQLHPICHGASCPLVRIENNIRPCPPAKSNLQEYIVTAYYETVMNNG
ncbi:radical SAM protein [Caldifermentibacillus hisashii]|uniref:radical SAM protein n=1 Tax=Caldifermentibacillus hisashii TaxID=996558 RepID=UPI0037C1463B